MSKPRRNAKLNVVSGEKITSERQRTRMTQHELAVAVGTQANQISTWERGVHGPNVLLLYRLAKFFGRDMEWFVDRERIPALDK